MQLSMICISSGEIHIHTGQYEHIIHKKKAQEFFVTLADNAYHLSS